MQLVQNKGRRNHQEVLSDLLKTSNRALLCSGWLKLKGIERLLPAIDQALARSAEITIYSNIEHTESEAAAAISARPALKHFIIPKPYLHSKLYYFEIDETYTALVGSANITAGGLGPNNELSVRFSGLLGDEIHVNLNSYIDGLRKLSGER